MTALSRWERLLPFDSDSIFSDVGSVRLVLLPSYFIENTSVSSSCTTSITDASPFAAVTAGTASSSRVEWRSRAGAAEDLARDAINEGGFPSLLCGGANEKEKAITSSGGFSSASPALAEHIRHWWKGTPTALARKAYRDWFHRDISCTRVRVRMCSFPSTCIQTEMDGAYTHVIQHPNGSVGGSSSSRTSSDDWRVRGPGLVRKHESQDGSASLGFVEVPSSPPTPPPLLPSSSSLSSLIPPLPRCAAVLHHVSLLSQYEKLVCPTLYCSPLYALSSPPAAITTCSDTMWDAERMGTKKTKETEVEAWEHAYGKEKRGGLGHTMNPNLSPVSSSCTAGAAISSHRASDLVLHCSRRGGGGGRRMVPPPSTVQLLTCLANRALDFCLPVHSVLLFFSLTLLYVEGKAHLDQWGAVHASPAKEEDTDEEDAEEGEENAETDRNMDHDDVHAEQNKGVDEECQTLCCGTGTTEKGRRNTTENQDKGGSGGGEWEKQEDVSTLLPQQQLQDSSFSSSSPSSPPSSFGSRQQAIPQVGGRGEKNNDGGGEDGSRRARKKEKEKAGRPSRRNQKGSSSKRRRKKTSRHNRRSSPSGLFPEFSFTNFLEDLRQWKLKMLFQCRDKHFFIIPVMTSAKAGSDLTMTTPSTNTSTTDNKNNNSNIVAGNPSSSSIKWKKQEDEQENCAIGKNEEKAGEGSSISSSNAQSSTTTAPTTSSYSERYLLETCDLPHVGGGLVTTTTAAMRLLIEVGEEVERRRGATLTEDRPSGAPGVAWGSRNMPYFLDPEEKEDDDEEEEEEEEESDDLEGPLVPPSPSASSPSYKRKRRRSPTLNYPTTSIYQALTIMSSNRYYSMGRSYDGLEGGAAAGGRGEFDFLHLNMPSSHMRSMSGFLSSASSSPAMAAATTAALPSSSSLLSLRSFPLFAPLFPRFTPRHRHSFQLPPLPPDPLEVFFLPVWERVMYRCLHTPGALANVREWLLKEATLQWGKVEKADEVVRLRNWKRLHDRREWQIKVASERKRLRRLKRRKRKEGRREEEEKRSRQGWSKETKMKKEEGEYHASKATWSGGGASCSHLVLHSSPQVVLPSDEQLLNDGTFISLGLRHSSFIIRAPVQYDWDSPSLLLRPLLTPSPTSEMFGNSNNNNSGPHPASLTKRTYHSSSFSFPTRFLAWVGVRAEILQYGVATLQTLPPLPPRVEKESNNDEEEDEEEENSREKNEEESPWSTSSASERKSVINTEKPSSSPLSSPPPPPLSIRQVHRRAVTSFVDVVLRYDEEEEVEKQRIVNAEEEQRRRRGERGEKFTGTGRRINSVTRGRGSSGGGDLSSVPRRREGLEEEGYEGGFSSSSSTVISLWKKWWWWCPKYTSDPWASATRSRSVIIPEAAMPVLCTVEELADFLCRLGASLRLASGGLPSKALLLSRPQAKWVEYVLQKTRPSVYRAAVESGFLEWRVRANSQWVVLSFLSKSGKECNLGLPAGIAVTSEALHPPVSIRAVLGAGGAGAVNASEGKGSRASCGPSAGGAAGTSSSSFLSSIDPRFGKSSSTSSHVETGEEETAALPSALRNFWHRGHLSDCEAYLHLLLQGKVGEARRGGGGGGEIDGDKKNYLQGQRQEKEPDPLNTSSRKEVHAMGVSCKAMESIGEKSSIWVEYLVLDPLSSPASTATATVVFSSSLQGNQHSAPRSSTIPSIQNNNNHHSDNKATHPHAFLASFEVLGRIDHCRGGQGVSEEETHDHENEKEGGLPHEKKKEEKKEQQQEEEQCEARNDYSAPSPLSNRTPTAVASSSSSIISSTIETKKNIRVHHSGEAHASRPSTGINTGLRVYSLSRAEESALSHILQSHPRVLDVIGCGLHQLYICSSRELQDWRASVEKEQEERRGSARRGLSASPSHRLDHHHHAAVNSHSGGGDSESGGEASVDHGKSGEKAKGEEVVLLLRRVCGVVLRWSLKCCYENSCFCCCCSSNSGATSSPLLYSHTFNDGTPKRHPLRPPSRVMWVSQRLPPPPVLLDRKGLNHPSSSTKPSTNTNTSRSSSKGSLCPNWMPEKEKQKETEWNKEDNEEEERKPPMRLVRGSSNSSAGGSHTSRMRSFPLSPPPMTKRFFDGLLMHYMRSLLKKYHHISPSFQSSPSSGLQKSSNLSPSHHASSSCVFPYAALEESSSFSPRLFGEPASASARREDTHVLHNDEENEVKLKQEEKEEKHAMTEIGFSGSTSTRTPTAVTTTSSPFGTREIATTITPPSTSLSHGGGEEDSAHASARSSPTRHRTTLYSTDRQLVLYALRHHPCYFSAVKGCGIREVFVSYIDGEEDQSCKDDRGFDTQNEREVETCARIQEDGIQNEDQSHPPPPHHQHDTTPPSPPPSYPPWRKHSYRSHQPLLLLEYQCGAVREANDFLAQCFSPSPPFSIFGHQQVVQKVAQSA